MHVAAHRDQYHCPNCRWGRHCDEDLRWPTSVGPAGFLAFAISNVIESKTCFLPMITPFSSRMLNLYGHYKNSVFPLSGGLLEQPNLYLRAMELIDSTMNKLSREKTRG